jgi:hypothetical protein
MATGISRLTQHFAAVYGLSFLVPAAWVVFWLAMFLWGLSVIGMIAQTSGRRLLSCRELSEETLE